MSLCRAYFSAFCYFKSNNSLPANKAYTFMFLVSYCHNTSWLKVKVKKKFFNGFCAHLRLVCLCLFDDRTFSQTQLTT